MTTKSLPANAAALAQFEGPWRDDVPVFGCCRKSVTTAVDAVDLLELSAADVTTRVRALREAVEASTPGHLASHRCCSGHLADLAFDLPQLVAPVDTV